MNAIDVTVFAATIGVVMGLIEIIKLVVKKRNGSISDGGGSSAHLVDIGRDQLKVLHTIDKELAGMRSDLRSLWVAQNHLDRKVDALHRRFDSARRAGSDA